MAEPHHFTILMAYSPDYSLGQLCSRVNAAYARRHGYGFVCETIGTAELEEGRTAHWHKVRMLRAHMGALLAHRRAMLLVSPNHALADVAEDCGGGGGGGGGSAASRQLDAVLGCPSRAPPPPLPSGLDARSTFLVWIDADAVVVRHDLGLSQLLGLLPQAGAAKQLICGEDLSTACRLNTGVLLCRVSGWSERLWADVWSADSSRRYHARLFHEQAALEKQLEARGEGIGAGAPFHSYARGGPAEPKLFPHTCVLPRRMLNSNCDAEAALCFHAVGLGNKLAALRSAVARAGLGGLVDGVGELQGELSWVRPAAARKQVIMAQGLAPHTQQVTYVDVDN